MVFLQVGHPLSLTDLPIVEDLPGIILQCDTGQDRRHPWVALPCSSRAHTKKPSVIPHAPPVLTAPALASGARGRMGGLAERS